MNTEFPKKIADNVTLFSPDPIVYVVDSFLTETECDEFIRLAEGKMERATVISPDKHIVHDSRTNTFCWLQHDASELIHEISKRFSILVQMPIRNAEQFQVVHYAPGTEYKAHFDAFDRLTDDGQKNWEPGGQRLITALVYLNDVLKGGATYFPNLDISISPKKGDVLVFHNCLQDSTTIHPMSLHGGASVENGEKWAANLWFREDLRY